MTSELQLQQLGKEPGHLGPGSLGQVIYGESLTPTENRQHPAVVPGRGSCRREKKP